MRFLELAIRNFRGFGPETELLNLDSDLILFFGPNAYGKTSLSEAIEWLFYGSTKRRRRGEELNRTEYQGTFRNVHGGTPTEVTARVRLRNGREHTLSRRIGGGAANERGTTLVDGVLGDFGALDLRAIEAVYPVIAQHGLQTFIHTRPRDRRDAISAAFGLDELATFKTALDGARRSFNAMPPAAVSNGRNTLRALAPGLALLPQTADVAKRWQRAPQPQVRRDADLAALVAAARTLTGEDSDDVTALLNVLRTLRTETARQVFDIAYVAPPIDSGTQWERASGGVASLSAKTEELGKELVSLTAIAVSEAAELLKFWETGLGLASPHTDQCPMCEADSLPSEKRADLRRRLEGARTTIEANKKIVELINQIRVLIQQVRQYITAAVRPGMPAEERAFLDRIFEGDETTFHVFITAGMALDLNISAISIAGDTLEEYLKNTPASLTDVRNVPALIADIESLPKAFCDAFRMAQVAAEQYTAAWRTFEPVLQGRISSTEKISIIDAVGKALREASLIDQIACYETLLDQSLSLMQSIESALRSHQEELLSTRGEEISELYNLMNPAAEVRFARMVPATDSLRLEATSFGVPMSAAANLSECQLNCLGLAVAAMQATTPGSPFGFVLLDDPVQAMDDEHCESFLAAVLPQLLDQHHKQVIVLSHLAPIIDRARALNIDRDVRVYHFENYSRTGPEIVEQIKLRKQVSEIKGLMAGNEANRRLAVDRLRVLVEATVRELHAQIVRQPVPPEFDTARPSDLLRLFRAIPGTSPKEYQGLADTVDFSDPAHHTDAGYTVPTRGNIQPHLDRIVGLVERFHLA